ncbi:PREDICTED: uncharacterized protein LOC107340073 isoform X2 [Acropora digitifera]|uniref:uncharacterized protein LOC107340073 isoform X2 n=1 Tax=Acropora digitifera TaxID=70779 RepID=UPI00077A4F2B|nr:PREDICTED: uncharacterized protein LOC107340073 isoform X2 [Acropora digitifera]
MCSYTDVYICLFLQINATNTMRTKKVYLYLNNALEFKFWVTNGLDREYSFTNRGGSAWGHGSGEERSSISPVLLTVLVTLIFLAVLLHQCMWFFSQVTIVLGDDYGGMFEGQSSQSENSCDPIIEIRVEVKT